MKKITIFICFTLIFCFSNSITIFATQHKTTNSSYINKIYVNDSIQNYNSQIKKHEATSIKVRGEYRFGTNIIKK